MSSMGSNPLTGYTRRVVVDGYQGHKVVVGVGCVVVVVIISRRRG
jgi:hypothetical protein